MFKALGHSALASQELCLQPLFSEGNCECNPAGTPQTLLGEAMDLGSHKDPRSYTDPSFVHLGDFSLVGRIVWER